MSGRYVPITRLEFETTMRDMGFVVNPSIAAGELVYDRQVERKSGRKYDALVRIYSTIGVDSAVSRSVGSDAIRLVLIQKSSGRPVGRAEARVFRTKSALVNVQKRARLLFTSVFENECDQCGRTHGGFLRKTNGRSGEFMGCIRYPECKRTRPVGG